MASPYRIPPNFENHPVHPTRFLGFGLALCIGYVGWAILEWDSTSSASSRDETCPQENRDRAPWTQSFILTPRSEDLRPFSSMARA